MKKNKRRPLSTNKTGQKQQRKPDGFFPAEEPGFSFVAGYTSWGFPYGVLEEEETEDTFQTEDEELPF